MKIEDDNKCGGRGQCSYCDEIVNNVSYHEEHECPENMSAMARKMPKPKHLESVPSATCNCCHNNDEGDWGE